MRIIVDEIKQQLGGKWALERSDNFEEALKEMGETLYIVSHISCINGH